MQKFISWTLLTIFIWYLSVGNIKILYAQDKQFKKTIAVLNMQAKAGISKSGAGTLSDRLRSELVNVNVYTVLERGEMNSILVEQGFNQTGCTTSECAVEAGRLLGVQQMVAGDVGKIGDLLTIDVRVFNVETGEIVEAYQENYKGDAAGLLELMRTIARKISGLDATEGGFPWLWVGVGAVAVGGLVAILSSGKDQGTTENGGVMALPNPDWPPGQ